MDGASNWVDFDSLVRNSRQRLQITGNNKFKAINRQKHARYRTKIQVNALKRNWLMRRSWNKHRSEYKVAEIVGLRPLGLLLILSSYGHSSLVGLNILFWTTPSNSICISVPWTNWHFQMMLFYLENPWQFIDNLHAFIIQQGVIPDSIHHQWCLPKCLEIISF